MFNHFCLSLKKKKAEDRHRNIQDNVFGNVPVGSDQLEHMSTCSHEVKGFFFFKYIFLFLQPDNLRENLRQMEKT